MIVSLAFSFVIYRAAIFELNRFARTQQNRFAMRPSPPPFNDDLLDDAQVRIVNKLILINIGILLSAGVFGYYLSGKTLEPISEMIDEQYRFVSDASHELKTPLTAMKSTIEVALRDRKMNLDTARKTLEVSLGEVNDLQRLAEGLLELSGHAKSLKREKLQLSIVIMEAIVALEPLAHLHKIQISTRIDDVFIMGESETLKRAITTIIDNAIKYSKDKSKITISSEHSGKSVVVKIKDEGIGIEETEMPLIFNRFYRSDKSRNTDGHGLGLSIAKEIVEAQDGEITVQSKKGKGTTVSLTFHYSARIQN